MDDGAASPPAKKKRRVTFQNAKDGPSRHKLRAHDERPRWDDTPQGYDWYYADFTRHTEEVRARLDGGADEYHSRVREGRPILREMPVLRNSLVGPIGGYWTGEEKARFFAALNRHSRHRPELIARELGTKSAAAVDEYVDVLREGKRRATAGYRDRSLTARSLHKRVLISGAAEVGSDWVEKEEKLAEVVGRTHYVYERARIEQDRRPSELERWGRSLDAGKLVIIDSTVRLGDISEVTEDSKLDLGVLVGMDEVDMIARDDHEITLLREIPKLNRSTDERARLTTLINRRRNRQKHRRKVLRNEGMTDEQIDERGGPDAIYARENRGKKRPGAPRKDKLDVEPLHEMPQLNQLELDKYFSERGWEMFSYDRISQLMERYVQVHGEDEQARRLSFAVIEQLHARLVAFVLRLMFQATLMADQDPRDTSDITDYHVNAVLALRGAEDPREALSKVVKRLAGDADAVANLTDADDSKMDEVMNGDVKSDDGDDEHSEDEASSPPLRSMSSSPSPGARGSPPRRRSRSASPTTVSGVGLEPWKNVVPEIWPEQGKLLPDRLLGTVTDDEDEQLEEQLSDFDRAVDEAIADQLDEAVALNRRSRVVNEYPWTKGRTVSRENRSLKPLHVSARMKGEIREARQSYMDLFKAIRRDRERRHMKRDRARWFPRYQTSLKAAHMRHAKTPYTVVLQESESEDEWRSRASSSDELISLGRWSDGERTGDELQSGDSDGKLDSDGAENEDEKEDTGGEDDNGKEDVTNEEDERQEESEMGDEKDEASGGDDNPGEAEDVESSNSQDAGQDDEAAPSHEEDELEPSSDAEMLERRADSVSDHQGSGRESSSEPPPPQLGGRGSTASSPTAQTESPHDSQEDASDMDDYDESGEDESPPRDTEQRQASWRTESSTSSRSPSGSPPIFIPAPAPLPYQEEDLELYGGDDALDSDSD